MGITDKQPVAGTLIRAEKNGRTTRSGVLAKRSDTSGAKGIRIEFMDIDHTDGTGTIDLSVPQSNPYFKITPFSRMLNLDLLVAREPADPDRMVRAKILMEQASTSVGEKRNPIGIVPLDNGKFRVLDGNTTLQALRDLGETVAIVEIMQAITDPEIPSSIQP
jgi:hypothetical protein